MRATYSRGWRIVKHLRIRAQGDTAKAKAAYQDFLALWKLYRGEAKAKARLDWWARSRTEILAEVKALRNLLRAKLSSERTPSKEELISTVLSTIKGKESEFPKLIQIGEAFIAFLFSNVATLRSLLLGGVSPADFTGELLQWATNYKPESARQLISRYNRPDS